MDNGHVIIKFRSFCELPGASYKKEASIVLFALDNSTVAINTCLVLLPFANEDVESIESCE